MAQIIKNITKDIKNNKLLTNDILSPLKLDKVKDDNTFFSILLNFLTLAYSEGVNEAESTVRDHNIRFIIDYFEEGYNFTSLSIILYLMVIDTDEELMRYILKLYSNKTYKMLMMELISWDSSPEIFNYLEKLEFYFPNISNNQYKELYTYALEESDISNTVIIEYLSKKLEKTSHGKSKPWWILPLTPSNGSPSKGSSSKGIMGPTVDEALDIIADKLGLDKKILYKQFAPEYRLSTLFEKKLMLDNTNKITQQQIDQDIENFKLYGPVNHFDDDSDRSESNDCAKHGGCRMLTCNDMATYDNDQDLYNFEGAIREQFASMLEDIDDDEMDENLKREIDWFTGVCQECHEKIEKKHYALRIPQLDGGWKGCYCSFECIENDTEDLDTFSSRMKTQLEMYGIYDR